MYNKIVEKIGDLVLSFVLFHFFLVRMSLASLVLNSGSLFVTVPFRVGR